MTPAFLTYAPGAGIPYAAWPDDLATATFLQPAEIVGELAALPRWEFVADTSLRPNQPVNRTGYPVVDCDGRPLWESCRIEVRFGMRGNSQTVSARYLGTGEYMITRVKTDVACRRYKCDPRAGLIGLPEGCDHDLTTSTFKADHALGGTILLFNEVGNHDIGFDQHYVRLLDDPRTVCVPLKRTRRIKGA